LRWVSRQNIYFTRQFPKEKHPSNLQAVLLPKRITYLSSPEHTRTASNSFIHNAIYAQLATTTASLSPSSITALRRLFKKKKASTASHLQITMRSFFTTGFIAAASLLSLTAAHNIQLHPHSRECFHENLHKDDRMTVSFQVGDREFGGAGNLDVDFWVCLFFFFFLDLLPFYPSNLTGDNTNQISVFCIFTTY